MIKRKLGSQGLEVPAIGLGCMGMSVEYGELDEDKSIDTIQYAIEIGLNLLVTSDMYGNGRNETLLVARKEFERHGRCFSRRDCQKSG